MWRRLKGMETPALLTSWYTRPIDRVSAGFETGQQSGLKFVGAKNVTLVLATCNASLQSCNNHNTYDLQWQDGTELVVVQLLAKLTVLSSRYIKSSHACQFTYQSQPLGFVL